MTLDEAIKHAEEVADVCEFEASKYDMTDAYESYVACREGECAEEHRQLAEWLKELKQLRNQTSWIPVSERLPEKNGNYLCTVDYGEDGIEVMQRNYRDTLGGFDKRYNKNDKVIAWMPLPEPYKEAENEL